MRSGIYITLVDVRPLFCRAVSLNTFLHLKTEILTMFSPVVLLPLFNSSIYVGLGASSSFWPFNRLVLNRPCVL